MKRVKNAWALLLCLCMAVTLLPMTSFAAGNEVGVDSLALLQTAINDSTGTADVPTTIRVTAPITVSGKKDTISIPAGKHIQLSGEAVSKTNASYGATSLFKVSDNSSLTLCDISVSSQYEYTVDVTSGGKLTLNSGAAIHNIGKASGINVTGGKLILNSGSLIEGTTAENYGIYLTGGSCTMNGGTIRTQASGIFAEGSAEVQLNGGVITGCKTTGICVYNATCTMEDGMTFTQNTGASINTYSPSVFSMNGGKIINNNDTTYNGGAINGNGGTLNLKGGRISDNSAADGGALYLESSTNVTMEGTVIEGNTASNKGGGIYITGRSTVTVKSGSICNNSANTEAGGVIVMAYSKLILEGGEIAGNTAPKYAGISSTVDPVTVQGSAVVKNNLITGTQTESNIFADRIQVNGSLSGEIGITLRTPALGSVLALGESYTLTEADAVCFREDSGAFGVVLSGNNAVLAAAAAEPEIQRDLDRENMDVTQGEEDVSLSVGATNQDGGVITYQWFVKTEESGNFAPVEGADAATFTPDLSRDGTYWYYVQITNTKNGTAKTTDSAIKKLTVLALANYTAVDAAVAKAEALNKAEYKDFSAVERAIVAVVRGKNITEQSTVDAMAKAIENEISALEKKPAPTPSESEQPSKPSTPEDKPATDIPQTGDNSNSLLWAVLLLLASGGLMGIALYARKRETN